MPLLDSFLKESARMNSVDAMSVRRTALRDFTFQDGTVVHKGNWVGVPQQAILLDSANFPHGQDFNGFRFVDPGMLDRLSEQGKLNRDLCRVRQPEGPSKFFDVSPNYHVWGLERMACPGRFYVSGALKSVLIHVLENYECELEKPSESRTQTWRTYLLPREDTKVVFSPRKQQAKGKYRNNLV